MRDVAPAPIAPAEIPLRPQDEVECRRCEVHCDRVVHPAACIARDCPFVYAYEAWGHTYMGCMQKVFDVEIDLDLLDELGCVNPEFYELPVGEPSFRVFAEIRSTPET